MSAFSFMPVWTGACPGVHHLRRLQLPHGGGAFACFMYSYRSGLLNLLPTPLGFYIGWHLCTQEFQIRILDVDKFNSSKSLHVCNYVLAD